MLVRVMYQNDKFDLVKPFILDKLMSSGKLKKFLRLEGWVAIGIDPIRTTAISYKGLERRKDFKYAIKAEFWT